MKDSGYYQCMAENAAGFVMAFARVKIFMESKLYLFVPWEIFPAFLLSANFSKSTFFFSKNLLGNTIRVSNNLVPNAYFYLYFYINFKKKKKKKIFLKYNQSVKRFGYTSGPKFCSA